MRPMLLVLMVLVSGCAAGITAGPDEQNEASLPGNDARRDGFYDGGVFDPDLTQSNIPLPE